MDTNSVDVELQFTPNPSTLKYVVNTEFIPSGAENYTSRAHAEDKSPLAIKLFEVKDIVGVMVAKNFVTITLGSQERLTELNEEVVEVLKNFVASEVPAVHPEHLGVAEKLDLSKLGDVEKQILKILDEEIRPAVAADGGDITFHKYEDGVLFLQMKGACAGCPSSTATLKMGIENRVREVVPDLKEVLAI